MKRIIITAIFMALTVCIHSQSNVIEVEYFLDTDLGFGMNTVLDIASPNIDITETILADIPGSTSIGYHKLYIRTKDANGHWSHTIRKNIEIFSPVENNIVMGEYFIDEELTFGLANTFDINPEAEDVEQAFEAQILASTTLGYHKLYGRIRDAQGHWSHTFRKNIEVYLNPDTNVVEIEYFFVDEGDSGFGNNLNIVTLDTPEADGTWVFNVDYPDGIYDDIAEIDVLFLRVKGSNQRWSITTTLDEIGQFDETMSVENSLFNAVTVSPNPFTNQIDINTTRAIIIEQVAIFDITGKKVYSVSEDLRTIDLSHLNSGIYFLKLLNDTEQATFKLIKQ